MTVTSLVKRKERLAKEQQPVSFADMSLVDQAKEMQRQAALAANIIADELLVDLRSIAARCAEIQDLTGVPDGVRQEMARTSEEIGKRLQTIEAIRGRV